MNFQRKTIDSIHSYAYKTSFETTF